MTLFVQPDGGIRSAMDAEGISHGNIGLCEYGRLAQFLERVFPDGIYRKLSQMPSGQGYRIDLSLKPLPGVWYDGEDIDIKVSVENTELFKQLQQAFQGHQGIQGCHQDILGGRQVQVIWIALDQLHEIWNYLPNCSVVQTSTWSLAVS